MKRRGTIREYAEELLRRVNFIDIYGRAIGYDYPHILTLIKKRFPQSSGSGGNYGRKGFTMAALRDTRSKMTTRLPSRLRSRRRLAREYTRALVMYADETGTGLSFDTIQRRVRAKFPEQPLLSLHHVTGYMARCGSKLPTRPDNG